MLSWKFNNHPAARTEYWNVPKRPAEEAISPTLYLRGDLAFLPFPISKVHVA